MKPMVQDSTDDRLTSRAFKIAINLWLFGERLLYGHRAEIAANDARPASPRSSLSARM